VDGASNLNLNGQTIIQSASALKSEYHCTSALNRKINAQNQYAGGSLVLSEVPAFHMTAYRTIWSTAFATSATHAPLPVRVARPSGCQACIIHDHWQTLCVQVVALPAAQRLLRGRATQKPGQA
jgi:hypothetical protein